jgi:hypothetical protein
LKASIRRLVCFSASSSVTWSIWLVCRLIIRYALTVHVNKSKVRARKDHSLAHDKTQTTSTTSDDTDVTIKRKCRKCGLHVLATSAGDGLTARELMVFWVFDLDLRISLGVFPWLILARRATVKLSCTSKRDRRADQSRGGNPARTKAQSRCKRHCRRATLQSAGTTRRCVKEKEEKRKGRPCPERDDIAL